jgi:hypothetical protein
VLVALVAYFALTLNGSAGAGPATASIAPAGRENGQIGQYHGTVGRQYHGIAATSGQLSAWQRASRSADGEFNGPIATKVISPIFTSHSEIANANTQKRFDSPSDERTGAQNGHSIGAQIGAGTESRNGDPRLMLQIGAVFGLIYVGLLGVWFWATRFRMGRPSRSART